MKLCSRCGRKLDRPNGVDPPGHAPGCSFMRAKRSPRPARDYHACADVREGYASNHLHNPNPLPTAAEIRGPLSEHEEESE